MRPKYDFVIVAMPRSQEWLRGLEKQALVDGDMLTSRKPGDIPVFNCEMPKLFCKQARLSAKLKLRFQ
jgi:hypothetical protein